MHQKVACLIPGQGTYLGCWFSFPLSLPSPLSQIDKEKKEVLLQMGFQSETYCVDKQ